MLFLTSFRVSHGIRLLVVAALVCAAFKGELRAVPPSPGNGPPNPDLDSWSFNSAGWASDRGFAPISYSTNLMTSDLGDGTCLVMDHTNAAWLQYNVTESDGTNELTLNQGTVTLWFAPDWTDTNNGGTGPGQPGRFIEVGTYTTNASIGWWSLWLDKTGTNVYFSAQTNGSATTYFSAPVTWNLTNRWHMLTITYCATNSAFYWDNTLVTNGLPVTTWPSPTVQSNGFFLGSDSTGIAQVHGMIDDVQTFSYPLASSNVAAIFQQESFYYYANPLNRANFATDPSYPTNTLYFSVVSGMGGLTRIGTNSCVSSSSFWLTNFTASAMSSTGTVTVTFGIAGGWEGLTGPFDVFATSILNATNISYSPWAWVGQGYSCYTYSLILSNSPFSAYLLLGSPQDSDGDGLTDAYELLVSHTNPNNMFSAGDGIPDGWKVLWTLSTTNIASQDPDRDALLNLQEYSWGSNPTRNDGLTPWVGSPNTASGIP
ncbi:MAG TPA: LamG-like jellyroll fold domain-containing protein [Verrucomicrobiae bacterium]|nr:LamG-like jellyroll fold domain-containing protein [Verrucomicrobiae bacterium]